MVKVRVILVDNHKQTSLYEHEFAFPPRTGDCVEIENDEHQAICYDVVRVVVAKRGADIFVAHPRSMTDEHMTLEGQF